MGMGEDELASFLRDINRQARLSNESYCEYAVERLEVCIHSISQLLDQLRTRPAHVTDGVADVAAHYSVQLAVLETVNGKGTVMMHIICHYPPIQYPHHTLPLEGGQNLDLENKSATFVQCHFLGYKLLDC